MWFDALGLCVFAVLGARRGLLVTGDPAISVMMGVITAVVGGLLRDVIAGKCRWYCIVKSMQQQLSPGP